MLPLSCYMFLLQLTAKNCSVCSDCFHFLYSSTNQSSQQRRSLTNPWVLGNCSGGGRRTIVGQYRRIKATPPQGRREMHSGEKRNWELKKHRKGCKCWPRQVADVLGEGILELTLPSKEHPEPTRLCLFHTNPLMCYYLTTMLKTAI